MTEERFEEFLKQALHDVDPVPPTPREEMWARIREQRERTPVIELETRRNKKTWLSWAVGLAAMLAIGIGIGRMSMRSGVAPQVAQAPAPANNEEVGAPANVNANATESYVSRRNTTIGSAPTNARSATAYRLAVSEYMSSAEALLTSFRAQEKGAEDPDLAVWARDLLTNTRLLLDSPAASDPKVAALLEDLELIIAQIARMQAPSTDERDIIRDGMNKTAVLPRLRATQPAGT